MGKQILSHVLRLRSLFRRLSWLYSWYFRHGGGYRVCNLQPACYSRGTRQHSLNRPVCSTPVFLVYVVFKLGSRRFYKNGMNKTQNWKVFQYWNSNFSWSNSLKMFMLYLYDMKALKDAISVSLTIFTGGALAPLFLLPL